MMNAGHLICIDNFCMYIFLIWAVAPEVEEGLSASQHTALGDKVNPQVKKRLDKLGNTAVL